MLGEVPDDVDGLHPAAAATAMEARVHIDRSSDLLCYSLLRSALLWALVEGDGI